MKWVKRTLMVGLLAVGGLVAACGGSDESGICVADFGNIVECFDCWDKEDCTESYQTWNTAYDSCPDAGYSSPTSNACGYTH